MLPSICFTEFSNLITNEFGGWYFSIGGRLLGVGDACAFNFGAYSDSYNIALGEKKYLIPQIWMPGVGCVLSKMQQ